MWEGIPEFVALEPVMEWLHMDVLEVKIGGGDGDYRGISEGIGNTDGNCNIRALLNQYLEKVSDQSVNGTQCKLGHKQFWIGSHCRKGDQWEIGKVTDALVVLNV